MTESKKRKNGPKRERYGGPPPKGLEARQNSGTLCTATRRNGEPCTNFAILGAPVCRVHGGNLPSVRRAAQVRLLRSADRLMAELLDIALDKKQPVQARLIAIRDGLDRANLGAKASVEVTVEKGKSFDDVVEASLVVIDGNDDGTNEFDALDAVIVEEDDEPEPPVQNRHDRAAFREHERARQSPPDPEQEPAATVRAIPKYRPKRSEDDAANQRSREAYMEAIAAGHSVAYARSAARRALAAETQSGPRYARRAPRNDED